MAGEESAVREKLIRKDQEGGQIALKEFIEKKQHNTNSLLPQNV